MNSFSRAALLFFTISLPLSPSSAQPLAIGPVKVDAEDLTGDEAHVQGNILSVWTGSHGIAAWVTWGKDTQMRLVAARFDRHGVLLGGPPVILAEGLPPVDGTKRTIGLSHSSGTVLITWQTPLQGILTRRLSLNLQWLDPEPFVLVPYTPGPFRPVTDICSAASPACHGILLAELQGVGSALTLVRLGNTPGSQPEILPVPPSPVAVSTALAARPDGFLLAWQGNSPEQRVVVARTAGLTGNTLGPVHLLADPLAIADFSQPSISAVPFGSGYAVAWMATVREPVSSYPEYPRYWRALDANGAPAAPAGELFAKDPNLPAGYIPIPFPVHLQTAGTSLVAFSNESVPELRAPYQQMIRRLIHPVTGMGETERFGEPQAMLADSVAVHDTGSGLLAVGEARANAAYSYRRSAVAAPLSSDLKLTGPVELLSQGAPEQQTCAVACRGTDYLVVWQDGRNGHSHAAEIRGRLLTLSGTPAGPSFVISGSETEDISPAVAASGDKYLVAWSVNGGTREDDGVRGALVTGNGVVSPSFPLGSSPARGESGVAVAGGAGGGFFAAWRSNGDTEPDDIYGAWVTAAGTVFPENGFPVAVSPNKERAVTVAGGAATYGVAWRDGYGDSLAGIHATVLPAVPPVTPVTTPEKVTLTEPFSRAHAPEIGWNGNHYRIVWRNIDNTGMQSATLTEDKTTDFPVYIGDPGMEPAIAASNGTWHAFWYDYNGELKIVFASFNATGDIAETHRFAPRFADIDTLAVAAAPDGGILIAYPTGRMPGRESSPIGVTLYTGGIETVLLYPALPAADPAPRISMEGGFTTLRWKPDPYFPADARVWETGTGLSRWLPLQLFPLVLPVQNEGAEASVIFPSFPGANRFFRMTSSLAGPPQ